jgi:hypothetical protein
MNRFQMNNKKSTTTKEKDRETTTLYYNLSEVNELNEIYKILFHLNLSLSLFL